LQRSELDRLDHDVDLKNKQQQKNICAHQTTPLRFVAELEKILLAKTDPSIYSN